MALLQDLNHRLRIHLSNMSEAELQDYKSDMEEEAGDFLEDFFQNLYTYVQRLEGAVASVTFYGGKGITNDGDTKRLSPTWIKKKSYSRQGSASAQPYLWRGKTPANDSTKLINVLRQLAGLYASQLLPVFGGVEIDRRASRSSVLREGFVLTRRGQIRDLSTGRFTSYDKAYTSEARKTAAKFAKGGARSGKKGEMAARAKIKKLMTDGFTGFEAEANLLPKLESLTMDLRKDVIAELLQDNPEILTQVDNKGLRKFHYLKYQGQRSGGGKYVNHELLERAFMQSVTTASGFNGISLNNYLGG